MFVRLLSVFQYRIGQLYMISKHSHEQSERGEGVEVVQNEPYEDPEHGPGQFTEKRIYLNKWVSSSCNILYVKCTNPISKNFQNRIQWLI